MPTDRLTALNEMLRLEADRPLGDVSVISNRATSPISHGLQEAAENLLNKALKALRTGDHRRAETYTARAARLDFDDHEEVHPAWMQAHMLLFEAVTDALEECPDDDHSWLDAALAVLADCGEYARPELEQVLATVDHDWRLRPQESRRVQTALAGVTWSPGLESSPPEQDAERIRAILQILGAVASYQRALDLTDDLDLTDE